MSVAAEFNTLTLALVISLWGTTVMAANTPDESASAEPSALAEAEDNSPVVSDTMDITAYREIVLQLQSANGAYAAELPEKLLSLGLALQQQGRHDEALRIFKRGTHLARINNGLYTAEQIPLIQGEITSHIARGELIEADERQNYMLKVQQRSLANPDRRVQALMQQAIWQQNAYQLGIGEAPYDRLLNTWDLYRGALTDIASREGDTSQQLLTPLHGLLQTQYLIADYRGDGNSGGFTSDTSFAARQNQNRFNAYRAKSYKQGRAVIRAIYDVEKAQTDDQFLATADALVMLGDWMQWHGDKESALQSYLEAHGELAEIEDAQEKVAGIFGEPVALPAIEGVRPLPPLVPEQEADILLEFTVTERGRVEDLVRLDENEGNTGAANRLMRKLRSTQFRPRFEGGAPVRTEKVTYAYKLPR